MLKTLKSITATSCIAATLSLGTVAPVQAGSDPFLGEIMVFAGNFCPRGWVKANGALYPINQNTALFSIVGTQFGGDGRTTFGVPDLQGRRIVGTGAGSGLSDVSNGEKGGSESTTLQINNMPAHTHTATADASQSTIKVTSTMKAATTDANSTQPQNNHLAVSASDIYGTGTTTNATLAPSTIRSVVDYQADIKVTNSSTGGGQSISNEAPYLGMTICLAAVGVFPSRN